MKDKKIKIWISIFIGAMVITTAAASYAAQKDNLYKGLEIRNKPFASVLQYSNAQETAASQNPFRAFEQSRPSNSQLPDINTLKQIFDSALNPANAAGNAPTNNVDEIRPPANPQNNPVKSPCAPNSVPVIKNGQITECAFN